MAARRDGKTVSTSRACPYYFQSSFGRALYWHLSHASEQDQRSGRQTIAGRSGWQRPLIRLSRVSGLFHLIFENNLRASNKMPRGRDRPVSDAGRGVEGETHQRGDASSPSDEAIRRKMACPCGLRQHGAPASSGLLGISPFGYASSPFLAFSPVWPQRGGRGILLEALRYPDQRRPTERKPWGRRPEGLVAGRANPSEGLLTPKATRGMMDSNHRAYSSVG